MCHAWICKEDEVRKPSVNVRDMALALILILPLPQARRR